MRTLLLTLLLLVACESRPKPGSPPRPEEAPPPAAAEKKIAVEEAKEKPEPPAGQRPAPSPAELSGLDTYAAFSGDGLLFVWAEMSTGAGLPILHFVSSTTNTVEKSVLLTSESVRRELLSELDAEHFPRPGTPQKKPDELSVSLVDGQVMLRFGAVPAHAPWKPFASLGGVKAQGVDIAAVSADGAFVAVRVQGEGGAEFAPTTEFRVVRLFE